MRRRRRAFHVRLESSRRRWWLHVQRAAAVGPAVPAESAELPRSDR